MRNSFKGKSIGEDESVLFSPIQKYYEIIQDLIFKMNDFLEEGNLSGAVTTFERLYNLTYFYWFPYLNEGDLKGEEVISDMTDLKINVPVEGTKGQIMRAKDTYQQALTEFNYRERIL